MNFQLSLRDLRRFGCESYKRIFSQRLYSERIKKLIMGFTYVNVLIRGIKASKMIEMLVDTGSTYIVLGREIINELGLFETPYKVELMLADGRRAKAKLFLAEVEAKGRKGPALVAELDTPKPLLGVYALETLGFKVNPRTGELEEISPEGGYLLLMAPSIY